MPHDVPISTLHLASPESNIAAAAAAHTHSPTYVDGPRKNRIAGKLKWKENIFISRNNPTTFLQESRYCFYKAQFLSQELTLGLSCPYPKFYILFWMNICRQFIPSHVL